MLMQLLTTFKNIPRRAFNAMSYSLQGLASAYKKEESIRLEAIALIILTIVLALVPWPLWKKLAMTAFYLLIPLAELLNSSMENLCDLVSEEYDEKIKRAKDQGSAAVLAAMIINAIALAALILHP